MTWQTIDTAPQDGRVYEISTGGCFRVDGVLRSPYRTTRGYLRVTIGGRSTPVHRLVAIAFLPNPGGLPEVNHLDGDKENNALQNLEWCTRSGNMLHAYAHGLHPGVRFSGRDHPGFGKTGREHPQSMPVRATFKDGTIMDFDSQRLAESAGFRGNKISDCIAGRIKTHGGARWQPLPAPPAAMPHDLTDPRPTAQEHAP